MEDAYPVLTKLKIAQLAEEDKPREKLLLKGKSALSDAELLAILISSGNREESAVQLCQRILHDSGNNLHELGRLSVAELMNYKGIGDAKAISIVAALELGHRKRLSEFQKKMHVKSSRDIFNLMSPKLIDLPHEEFWVIFLNRSNKMTGTKKVSIGGITGTVADSRIIFKEAIERLSSAIIVCHNHPSGNLKPSTADIRLTKNLKEAGRLLEISLLDHVIIAEDGFYSFADDGML